MGHPGRVGMELLLRVGWKDGPQIHCWCPYKRRIRHRSIQRHREEGSEKTEAEIGMIRLLDQRIPRMASNHQDLGERYVVSTFSLKSLSK